MMLKPLIAVSALLILPQITLANPHWDKNQAPKEESFVSTNPIKINSKTLKIDSNPSGIDILRIQVDWNEANESYQMSHHVIEPSGTPALLARSTLKPKLGSYLGVLKDKESGKTLFYDAVGTGKEYRKLARAINLRFPLPKDDMLFELYAENPKSGIMELVLTQTITTPIKKAKPYAGRVVVKEIAQAEQSPALRVNIYAEGYLNTEQKQFWEHAVKAVESLKNQHFPGVEHMSFYAVFSPSSTNLGSPEDLGLPVPEFKTFLGLYFPYWDNFGRWYHVVYPTRENKFRQGLAVAPYDYPIVLVNDEGYWGVGNYMSHTAIPAGNSYYFTYLLMHEFGHFFGLNEEYEGGGRTELEFAKGIEEPWSQNITFLNTPNYSGLKWHDFANQAVRIPTPYGDWSSNPPNYGAYRGGYADSLGSKSYKPGLSCIMESYKSFCDICKQGVLDVIRHDLGVAMISP